MKQLQMVSLDLLVDPDHNYRKFLNIWSFKFASQQLKKLDKGNPFKGYGLLKLFKFLILQFMEDLSDRQLEKFLQENNAAKIFTGFELLENEVLPKVTHDKEAKVGCKGKDKFWYGYRACSTY